jgi:hypothetical protein
LILAIFSFLSSHLATLYLILLELLNSSIPTMDFDFIPDNWHGSLPCFQDLDQPAHLGRALRKDCLDLHKVWIRLTLQKVMRSGWMYAGFVNPASMGRATYYRQKHVTITNGTVDLSAAYLSARAQIFDAIPPTIIEEMIGQGFDFIGWDNELRDLCHLISVVHNFMVDVVNVSVNTEALLLELTQYFSVLLRSTNSSRMYLRLTRDRVRPKMSE